MQVLCTPNYAILYSVFRLAIITAIMKYPSILLCSDKQKICYELSDKYDRESDT
jgi:hypothetical protein